MCVVVHVWLLLEAMLVRLTNGLICFSVKFLGVNQWRIIHLRGVGQTFNINYKIFLLLFCNDNLSILFFSKMYMNRHEMVSMLFADIVNFTPLTTKFKGNKLVEILNDLFGKFDEAAEVSVELY